MTIIEIEAINCRKIDNELMQILSELGKNMLAEQGSIKITCKKVEENKE